MDLAEFKSALKDGRVGGVYIFAGEEEYLIRYYLSELRRAVGIDDAFKVFNNPVYDGEGVDFAAILEDVKAPPMMADFKLVEWRHADFSSMKEREYELLSELCDHVAELGYAAVAFTAVGEALDVGTPKRPSSFVKKFGGKINILTFPQSTDNQLYGWLKKHFDAEGVGVTLDTLRALVERSGHSMDVLKREVEKLAALAHQRGLEMLTPLEVEEVSSTTPESDTFALSNALTDRNRTAAYAALEELRFRRIDPAIVMGMLSRTVGEMLSVAMMLDDGKELGDVGEVLKMNPYKVKLYASAKNRYTTEKLREASDELVRMDAESKFGGISGYTMIEIYISKIM